MELASQHLKDILKEVFHHQAPHQALVVFDTQSELSRLLTDAYKVALPDAQFIDFDKHTPAQIHAEFAKLHASDLVVLVQSTNFRLEAFRCLLYTSPSPRDRTRSRMPSSA